MNKKYSMGLAYAIKNAPNIIKCVFYHIKRAKIT